MSAAESELPTPAPAAEEEQARTAQQQRVRNLKFDQPAVPPQYVRLDVGGTRYTTLLSTLCKHSSSMLSTMFGGLAEETGATIGLAKDSAGTYILDRDGPCFRLVGVKGTPACSKRSVNSIAFKPLAEGDRVLVPRNPRSCWHKGAHQQDGMRTGTIIEGVTVPAHLQYEHVIVKYDVGGEQSNYILASEIVKLG